MRTAEQRIAAYDARMVSSLIDPVLTAMVVIQQENYTAYAIDFVAKQDQLRALLDAYSIPTTLFAAYEAYNGELYHLWLVAGSGPAAIVVATALVTKYSGWISGGAANLKAIANAIYNIVVP